jgi:hypothetical protein
MSVILPGHGPESSWDYNPHSEERDMKTAHDQGKNQRMSGGSEMQRIL